MMLTQRNVKGYEISEKLCDLYAWGLSKSLDCSLNFQCRATYDTKLSALNHLQHIQAILKRRILKTNIFVVNERCVYLTNMFFVFLFFGDLLKIPFHFSSQENNAKTMRGLIKLVKIQQSVQSYCESRM